METIVILGMVFLLIMWLWFAFTMNGIYKELKDLNRKTAKQIEFLDYMVGSNVFDSDSPKEN